MKKSELKQLIREVIEEAVGGPSYVLYFVANRRSGYVEKLEGAKKFNTTQEASRYVDERATEEQGNRDWSSYSEDKMSGELLGVVDYRWTADYGEVHMIVCPVEKIDLLKQDKIHDIPDITPGDLEFLDQSK